MMVSGAEYLKVSLLRPDRSAMQESGDSRPDLGNIGVARNNPLAGGQGEMVSPAMVFTAEAHRVADLVEEVADVRDEIVESLRSRIESGSYKVSGEQIAEMMIRRMLADRVW